MSHHPIPTLEDLRHEFRHSDTFSSLDANHMFFQWEVKEDKRKIFTFRTPWGLYRFKRLASGVNIASAKCNNNLWALLTGLEGIVQIQDDIVVHGLGKQHDERLAKVLERLDSEGFTLRRDKCVFGQPEIAWFGKIYSKLGVSIDSTKTHTIQTMATPTTKEDTVYFCANGTVQPGISPSQPTGGHAIQNLCTAPSTAQGNKATHTLHLDNGLPKLI